MVTTGKNILPLIEARQLLPCGEQKAITLCVQPHDSLCLVGTDSKRLSHYLRALAGVEPPQAGELHLLGIPLRELDKQRWRLQRQQIGFVARNAAILSVLRGLDNVMLPALYHKRMTRQQAKERAMILISETGFEGNLHSLPAYLKPQQRLQLAIARATILEPKILFLEEPFSELSLAEQAPINEYLVSNAGRRAQVITTHSLQLVKESASQILFIGNETLLHFTEWQEFIQCQDKEIEGYLELYRQQYNIN